jgi:hypothetical protein
LTKVQAQQAAVVILPDIVVESLCIVRAYLLSVPVLEFAPPVRPSVSASI